MVCSYSTTHVHAYTPPTKYGRQWKRKPDLGVPFEEYRTVPNQTVTLNLIEAFITKYSTETEHAECTSLVTAQMCTYLNRKSFLMSKEINVPPKSLTTPHFNGAILSLFNLPVCCPPLFPLSLLARALLTTTNPSMVLK